MIDWRDTGMQKQQRKFARRPVRLPTRLRLGGRELSGETENISPGGAFLRAKLPENAKEIIAHIGLPEGRHLHVRARIRWRRQDPAGVGIEFESFLEETT